MSEYSRGQEIPVRWSRCRVERKFGRVPKLAAGASHRMAIDFAIHPGTKEVKNAAKRIQAVQRDHAPKLDAQPEKKD